MRLVAEFSERFPAADELQLAVHYLDVSPDSLELTLKQVLPRLFPGPPEPH
jgi:hypothetical protein